MIGVILEGFFWRFGIFRILGGGFSFWRDGNSNGFVFLGGFRRRFGKVIVKVIFELVV